jgi:uncharacterized Zn finger protein
MAISNLSLATIRNSSSEKSFERGEFLSRSRAVISLSQRGVLLQAIVEGSNVNPYVVQGTVIPNGGLMEITCSCPYDFGGWCKHIVAVVLICSQRPQEVEQLSSLDQLMSGLNLSEMNLLIQELVWQQPRLVDNIDFAIGLIRNGPTPKNAAKRQTKIDPEPFRSQVQSILRNAVEGWESGYDDDSVTYEIEELIDKAAGFSAQSDGESAIAVLEAITQACCEDWHLVDEYGIDSYETMEKLDFAWTEAILSTEPSTEQRRTIGNWLQAWQDQLAEDFEMSLMALHQGWDDPLLLQVLAGEITSQGIWVGEVPKFADKLALIRLKILDRQERHQEYLYLAEAEGQIQEYTIMLGRLGRVEDAVAIAKSNLTTMAEAFALAQQLQIQGSSEQALEVAQLGLDLPDPKANEFRGELTYELVIWTSELAEGLGDRAIALKTRLTGFEAEPKLEDYQKLEDLANGDWSNLRQVLLQNLQNASGWRFDQAKVDIFLHENMIDQAIASVKGQLVYGSGGLLPLVMDAAISTHPDWVIENGKKQAEAVMDRGKASAYHHAIDWLCKVQAAYVQSGRRSEWVEYREQLLMTHGRKRNLVDLLKSLV